ncbi:CARDB domain-containing protein [Stigmatella hybrida]|uniref:CARDB domain-containing protein n=1 Tax=Stigmatella hybrida TaxID=394097 RepID=UPI001CDA72E5|nr:CARDB domain-containing protein [Stigmatella hybrida]
MRAARRLRKLASGVVACGWLVGCGGPGEVGPAELFVDTVVGAVVSSKAPDLWISSVSGPSSVLPGSAFGATVTACNQGVRSARASVHLVLSGDTGISVTDLRVGSVDTGLLHPNQCATLHVSVPAGTAIPEGRWYPGALVDPENEVPELSESNNARVGLPMAFGVGPDLTVAQVEAPDSLLPSGEFLTRVTVCNLGTVRAPAHVEVSLVPDAAPSGMGLGVGSASLEPLAEGQCQALRIPSRVDALPEGTYAVAARVDAAQAVSELEEGNNLRVGSPVAVGTRPDFVLSGVKGPASFGDTATLTATVCNQGTTAGTAQVEAFLSEDAQLTEADPRFGVASVEALPPGQCVPVNLSGPAGVSPGAYFLAAWVDRSQAVAELGEDNNLRVGARAAVGEGPDLTVTTVSAQRGAQAAHALEATATVCNQGTATSPATSLEFALSATASLPASAPVLAQARVPALEAGACAQVAGTGSAQVAEGSWYLGAWVDRPGSVRELLETNNSRTGHRLGMGEGPDLTLSAPPGQTGAGLVTVCNQGTQPTRRPTRVAFSRTADVSLSGAERLAGEAAVPILLPGQCLAVAPAGEGLAEGGGVLSAWVDPAQEEQELVEDNNTLTGSLLPGESAERWVVSVRR